MQQNKDFTCTLCKKTLSSKQRLISHQQKCDGLQSLQCKFCKKFYYHAQSKHRHQKQCKMKNIESPQEKLTLSQAIENTNIYNNVISFELSSINHTPFNSSHITTDIIKRIIDDFYYSDDDCDYWNILNEYNHTLFTLSENKCIKKTNRISNISQVHIGNGYWKFIKDNILLNKLIIDIIKSFHDKITECENKFLPLRAYNKKLYHVLELTQNLIDNKSHDFDRAKQSLFCTVLNISHH